jgi:hypothetical protein
VASARAPTGSSRHVGHGTRVRVAGDGPRGRDLLVNQGPPVPAPRLAYLKSRTPGSATRSQPKCAAPNRRLRTACPKPSPVPGRAGRRATPPPVAAPPGLRARCVPTTRRRRADIHLRTPPAAPH